MNGYEALGVIKTVIPHVIGGVFAGVDNKDIEEALDVLTKMVPRKYVAAKEPYDEDRFPQRYGVVYDCVDVVAAGIPTMEAAQRIADIYEANHRI